MKKKISFPLAIAIIIVLAILLIIIILKCDLFPGTTIPFLKSSEKSSEEPMETELSFSSRSCADLEAELYARTYEEGQSDSEPDPYNEETLGVKEIKWLDKTTLKIKAFVAVNCAESVEGGDYEIEGNKIILKYIPSGCDPCALCKCVSELNYEIRGLVEKEYEFELTED